MTKKEFALEQIKEYIQDSSKCGYEGGQCKNITSDGKMCVAGKNYLPKIRENFLSGSVVEVLRHNDYDQTRVFIPSSVNKLSAAQWVWLQEVHDAIAGISNYINLQSHPVFCDYEDTRLFTYEELIALKNERQ